MGELVLSDDEVALLEEARSLLRRVSTSMPHTWDGGRCSLACETAETAVGWALTVLDDTGMRPMSASASQARAPGSAQSVSDALRLPR